MSIKNFLFTALLFVITITHAMDNYQAIRPEGSPKKQAPLQCSSKTQKLFDAIGNGNTQHVINTLSAGADINGYNGFGRTPLGWLLVLYQLAKIETDTVLDIADVLFAHKNIDINKKDAIRSTHNSGEPVIFSILKNPCKFNLYMLKHLVQNPTLDLSIQHSGNSPLAYAQSQLEYYGSCNYVLNNMITILRIKGTK